MFAFCQIAFIFAVLATCTGAIVVKAPLSEDADIVTPCAPPRRRFIGDTEIDEPLKVHCQSIFNICFFEVARQPDHGCDP
ncbi:hypothetical protein C8J56DRAFT_1041793 [Mycena floridula]|nr:hypothetical protein C8J56DRAFT_1041793 [Mycena floridula]